jgi:hypothetical protein
MCREGLAWGGRHSGQTARMTASATCALHLTVTGRSKGESDPMMITSRKGERTTKEVALLTTVSSVPMSRATLSHFHACSSLSVSTATTTTPKIGGGARSSTFRHELIGAGLEEADCTQRLFALVFQLSVPMPEPERRNRSVSTPASDLTSHDQSMRLAASEDK